MSTNTKIKVGITGQHGFIGSHLVNNLGLYPDEFELVEFDRAYFDNTNNLDDFVKQCDVIVHLAALNRHESAQVIFDTNIELSNKLIDALKRTNSQAHVIVSSSTQEDQDNLYGQSKKKCRNLLADWAKSANTKFTGLVIPNVFGTFGKPFYNSFIATFCHQLCHGEAPTIKTDNVVNLIYVQELVDHIINCIRDGDSEHNNTVKPTQQIKVSEVLALLNNYKNSYFDQGKIPLINNSFEHNLFNTFRSYINHANHFPIKLTQHKDDRGAFVEVIRTEIGGQSSFSTTVSGVTRGNHYHTRKIERFTVIKGKALIQLRKIDDDKVLDFYLDGNEPAYVDMPIWYSHNIKNIGDEDLYTIFWIDEPYNPDDPDTYFLEV